VRPRTISIFDAPALLTDSSKGSKMLGPCDAASWCCRKAFSCDPKNSRRRPRKLPASFLLVRPLMSQARRKRKRNNKSSLLMRTRNRPVIIAMVVISTTAPLYAQRQQQDVAKLKADARNTVGIIGGDKAKTRRYCQIVDLTGELDQAIDQKKKKKAKALTQQVVQLQKQLPEFVALSNILEHVDLKSPDGREIGLIIQSLAESCPE
jgi:hypothetical protein